MKKIIALLFCVCGCLSAGESVLELPKKEVISQAKIEATVTSKDFSAAKASTDFLGKFATIKAIPLIAEEYQKNKLYTVFEAVVRTKINSYSYKLYRKSSSFDKKWYDDFCAKKPSSPNDWIKPKLFTLSGYIFNVKIESSTPKFKDDPVVKTITIEMTDDAELYAKMTAPKVEGK